MKPRIALFFWLALLSTAMLQQAFGQTTIIRTPVSFTISQAGRSGGPGPCPLLPSGLIVTATGDSIEVITSRTDQNGNTVLQDNVDVHGTATDNQDGSYVFSYHDHSTVVVPPNPALPVTIPIINDFFNLVGNGGANNLQVGFTGSIIINPDGTTTFTPRSIRGPLLVCDPI